MKKELILSKVDHTLLKPTATNEDIDRLCDEAVEFKTASVCVPPCYVKRCAKKLKGTDVKVCTVIGFPLGYSTIKTKIFETKQALKDGADEIDMVININDVMNEKYEIIRDEIFEIKQACKDKILKVIIETCYLNKMQKENLCRCVAEAKADYIKTSTGFGTAGATLEDVRLFKRCLKNTNVKIKAAGGIHTKEFMEALIKAGADRLGCSSAVTALKI